MNKKVKWVGILSTAERNHIGLIRVRQNNVNSEVLGFEIIDGNGEPYDLKNRKVLFCTYFDRFAPVEQYAEVIENGKIIYTMNEHDMQKPVRINFAYFKIMDDKDNLVDTTQNFSYDIMPSIESKCMNAEPYIIRLEEVLDAFLQINTDAKKELEQIIIDFNQQIIEQQQNFDLWFESIREILESVDPGGTVLNELVDFRYSKMLDKHFNRIEDRGNFWDESLKHLAYNLEWLEEGILNNIAKATEQIGKLVQGSNSTFIMPKQELTLSKFHVGARKNILGDGTNKVNLVAGNTPVLAGIRSFTNVEGVIFSSLEPDLEWNRFELANTKHTSLVDCIFEGFRHKSDEPNAWGIYLHDTKNAEIIRCGFSNNSLSDIAIVEGCSDILIDEAYNNLNPEEGIVIDIEPNTIKETENLHDRITRNVLIKNTHIKKLYIFENNYKINGTENIVLENCEVDELFYAGGSLKCVGSTKIKKITTPKPRDKEVLIGGALSLGSSISFSNELISDPGVTNFVLANNGVGEWRDHYLTGSYKDSIQKIDTPWGRYTRLGNRNKNEANRIRPLFTNSDYLYDAVLGDQFLLRIKGFGRSFTATSRVGTYLAVSERDNEGKVLQTSMIASVRLPLTDGISTIATTGGVYTVQNELTKFISIEVNNGWEYSNGEVYIESVSLLKIMEHGLPELPMGKSSMNIQNLPSIPGTINYFKGDKVYFKNPTTHEGAICTKAGYGGESEWSYFGKLEKL